MKWYISNPKFVDSFKYQRELKAVVYPEKVTADNLTPKWRWYVHFDNKSFDGVKPTYEEALESARLALAGILPDLIEDINTAGLT